MNVCRGVRRFVRKLFADVIVTILVFSAGTFLAAVFLGPAGLRAQDTAKAEPDTVVYADGEKLIGHFEGLIGGAAKFKSDTVGEIAIDLSKIQELHSSQRFAVIKKGVKLAKGETDGKIPHGTVLVANQTVTIDPGNGQAAQTAAIGDVSDIVDEADFLKALGRPGIFHNWKGGMAFGASLVEATQNSVSFNSSVNLVRAVPRADENWLPPRNRTLVAFSDSYGTVTQPNAPTAKTSIYHARAEQDEYFTSNVYAFGSVAFDHNFSQGLALQQAYGGGVGWTVIKEAKQTLDLKGSIDYERQSFDLALLNHSLGVSVFAEDYTRTLTHGIAVNEQLSVSPAWTQMRDYSAYASVAVIFPVYKRFGFTVNAIDSFLNDPPPAFKKNSVQFATGISYTLP
jgi:hypothetical protein